MSDPTALFTLRRLTLHPDWISVQSAICPQTPPRSPSPAGTSPHVVVVSDGEELVTSPSITRRMSKRLASRPSKVYSDSAGEEHPPVPFPMRSSDGDELPLTTPTSPCVHKASGRVRGTARMQCKKDSSSDGDDLPRTTPTSPCVHKASGRVRKTARMKCKPSSQSSDSDDDIPLHPHIPLKFAVGTMFNAPKYDRHNTPEAKDWLLHAFGSYHRGGHVVCCNSRLDYILAKCCKCAAKAAVTLKPPFSDHTWVITTVKEGADAACRCALPLPPPPPPACPASPPQKEMTCSLCFDQTTQHITCACASVTPHVVCWTCMDASIAAMQIFG